MNPKFFQFTETTSRLSLKDFKEIRLFFLKKTLNTQFFRRFRSQRPEICPRGLGFRISSRHHRQKLRHKNLFRKLLMRNRYFFFKFLGFFRNLQKSHFRKLKTPFGQFAEIWKTYTRNYEPKFFVIKNSIENSSLKSIYFLIFWNILEILI